MRALRFAAALLIAPLALAPFTGARAQVGVGMGVAITVAPPMLPDYAQPPMPEAGYMWTPGYWAYGDGDYYWVQGTWVLPPNAGMYWTPGYWAWRDGVYLFNMGYWGPEVGYYGGINYGYGYGGFGYQGGEWHGREFSYNRAANNFGRVHVENAYERPIERQREGGGERPSFNGPRGAIARPTAAEESAGRLGHMQPTEQQVQHVQAATQDRELRASVNGGHPAAGATERPRQSNGAAVREPAMAAPQQRQGIVAQPEREAAPPARHEAAPPQREAPQQSRQAAPEPRREAAPPPRQAPQRNEPERQAAPQQEHRAAPEREQHRESAPREEEHH